MAISREKKRAILDELKNIVANSQSMVFVNFHGINVSETTQLRRKLREAASGLYVAKKTLVCKALGESAVTGEMPSLEGELAIAYSADLIAPASSVYEFQNKLDGRVAILGGVFEGAYKDKEAMTEIASIPPLPVLRGMFVNIINSPIQRLAIALDQIAMAKN